MVMSNPNSDSRVSRSSATRAGKVLSGKVRDASAEEYRQATAVAQVWRAQHISATQHCFSQLLDCSTSFTNSVCTYRLKRLISIIRKLQRPEQHFKLGELDDIGGCRLIVQNNAQVLDAVAMVKSRLTLKNGGGEKDYITSPQNSGYRSHHLIANVGDGNGIYHVEIQIRTQLQHYWATAVEAAGELYGTEYKSPIVREQATHDDRERIRFFQIISSLFAQQEGTAPVPGHETRQSELVAELRALPCTATILNDLNAAANSVLLFPPNTDGNASLYLLKLSHDNQYLDVESFAQSQLSDALNRYAAVEERIESTPHAGNGPQQFDAEYDNVVLVHAQNIEQLRMAYPNYSANVAKFIDHVREYME